MRTILRKARIVGMVEAVCGLVPLPLLQVMKVLCDGSKSWAALGIRYFWLRRRAKSCGSDVFIATDVEFRAVERLIVGSRVSMHRWCFIDAGGGLEIGDDVSVAHGVSLISVSHGLDDPFMPIRDQPMVHRPVRIGNNVWIGAGACILSGVTITDRVVVGANAVVTKPIMFSGIYVGAPARKIRELPEAPEPAT